jgi:hypothetical protein
MLKSFRQLFLLNKEGEKFYAILFPNGNDDGNSGRFVHSIELDDDDQSGDWFIFKNYRQKIILYNYAVSTSCFRLQYFMLQYHKIHLSEKIYNFKPLQGWEERNMMFFRTDSNFMLRNSENIIFCNGLETNFDVMIEKSFFNESLYTEFFKQKSSNEAAS